MDTKSIQNRIHAVDEALTDKGFKLPECDITLTASDLTFWVKTGGSEADGRMLEPVYGDTFDKAFVAANEFVKNLESMETHIQREAVKKFGKAIDALRNSGISADFTDPLSEQLQAMTQNLLTDQRTAAE